MSGLFGYDTWDSSKAPVTTRDINKLNERIRNECAANQDKGKEAATKVTPEKAGSGGTQGTDPDDEDKQQAGPEQAKEETYYRKESSTMTEEVARKMEQSGELWGKEPQGSPFPQAQAYRGKLPDGIKGVEFTTSVPPNSPNAPMANWGGPNPIPGVRVEGGYAKIAITVTKNTF